MSKIIILAVLTNFREAKMGAGKPVKTMVHKVHWSALRTLQQLHQGVAGYFMYFEGFTEMLSIC